MRDATFALWGLYTLGFEWEANDYFAFLCDLVERDQGDLQIVYGIDGRRDLDEHILEHLNGYQGARPVRIGNAAYQQNQHDVWGVVLDSVCRHLGNFPQAFTHLALINAVMHVIRKEQAAQRVALGRDITDGYR